MTTLPLGIRGVTPVTGARTFCLFALLCAALLSVPSPLRGQEIRRDGWPVPDLKGLVPYSMTMGVVDGVERTVEKFFTSDGGHVARISGNGKVFAYVVDADRTPPIDYLLVDPDGFGLFTQKFRPEEAYVIPRWVSE